MRYYEEDAYLITGNIKHFPARDFIVTPSEMMDIIRRKDTESLQTYDTTKRCRLIFYFSKIPQVKLRCRGKAWNDRGNCGSLRGVWKSEEETSCWY